MEYNWTCALHRNIAMVLKNISPSYQQCNYYYPQVLMDCWGYATDSQGSWMCVECNWTYALHGNIVIVSENIPYCTSTITTVVPMSKSTVVNIVPTLRLHFCNSIDGRYQLKLEIYWIFMKIRWYCSQSHNYIIQYSIMLPFMWKSDHSNSHNQQHECQDAKIGWVRFSQKLWWLFPPRMYAGSEC